MGYRNRTLAMTSPSRSSNLRTIWYLISKRDPDVRMAAHSSISRPSVLHHSHHCVAGKRGSGLARVHSKGNISTTCIAHSASNGRCGSDFTVRKQRRRGRGRYHQQRRKRSEYTEKNQLNMNSYTFPSVTRLMDQTALKLDARISRMLQPLYGKLDRTMPLKLNKCATICSWTFPLLVMKSVLCY